MKKLIQTVFLLYLFWIFLFLTGKTSFIIYQFNFHLPPDFVKILFSGWKLDWSATSYLCAIPLILLCLNLFFNSTVLRKIFFGYHYLLIPIVITLTIANIILYKSWNTLLNAKALLYALQPLEMLASLTNKQIFFDFLFLVIACSAFVILFKRLIYWNDYSKIKSAIFKTVFSLLLIAFLIIGVRGGVQELPVNESAAAFSQNQIYNDIATNNIWYVSNSILKSGFKKHNLYEELNNDMATRIVSELYAGKKSDSKIINDSTQPNIVILLLESWTADIVEPMGGIKNITPFFSTLADSGLLFTNIYATGRRTDQALPSILCGFPAQPDRSIIRYSDKIDKLPFLTNILSKHHYASSFYYGGDLAFNNMHKFLVRAGFKTIIGKESFASNKQNSKWGAHDEYVLMKQAKDLNRQKQPFLSMLLTLTSHEPFEIPVAPKYPGKNDAALFINAINYSDESLKIYFNYARKQSWYPNTLFILVADHGHLLPLNREYYDPLSHRIPLLFYGDALKTEYKGKQDSTIGNQNDITSSLLNQLNLGAHNFRWSNDLFNPAAHHFAYINSDKYFGWLWNNTYYRYNSELRKIEKDAFLKKPVKEEILNGIAYRQKLLDEFIAY